MAKSKQAAPAAVAKVRKKRLNRVRQWRLGNGSHSGPPRGNKTTYVACVMEAVAYVAGEPWSDHPECACPVIAAFLRNWNDSLPDDETRTRLLAPLVTRLVGSKSTPVVEARRSWMALDWLARVQVQAWLELAGLREHSALCRELGELHDSASAESAEETLRSAGDAARAAAWAAAGDAARAAAWAAALDAARAAAWAAALDAAAAAAWAAALDAAAAAAWAAAGDAARAAAWAAAWAAALDAAAAAAAAAAGDAAAAAARAAAWDRLRPTVETLQASALELIDRMLAVES